MLGLPYLKVLNYKPYKMDLTLWEVLGFFIEGPRGTLTLFEGLHHGILPCWVFCSSLFFPQRAQSNYNIESRLSIVPIGPKVVPFWDYLIEF